MDIFNFQGIKLEQAPNEIIPNCPHCKKELRKIWTRIVGDGSGKATKYILICPKCKSFLAYSHIESQVEYKVEEQRENPYFEQETPLRPKKH